MKIDKLVLELTEEDCSNLSQLLNGFFEYQDNFGINEKSARTTLAYEILRNLPQPVKTEKFVIKPKSESYIDRTFTDEDVPF